MLEGDGDQLAAAVAAIRDGETVAFGGYFQHRHPMALVRELIRQGRRDLHIVTPLGGIDAELALASGIAGKITFGFVSMDAFGQSPAFRRTIESGDVAPVEYGDLALIRAMEAAERGLPWLPVRAWGGSDIAPHHPGAQIRESNGAGPLWRVPALEVDWALVHVPYATMRGDLALSGEGYDGAIVRSAKHVIATTERLVSAAELTRSRNGTTIARYRCDAVVELPYGAHPTSCFPFYVQDVPYLLDYMEANEDGAAELTAQVHDDERSYREALGVSRLVDLGRRMSLARRAADLYR